MTNKVTFAILNLSNSREI